MFSYKKNIFFVFSIVFILLVLTATTVFLIDPLQHYRKAKFYKIYSFEERYLSWGLLKNYNYDSILVGTSMTENFRKNYVDNDLNLDILRVPFSGSSAHEENLIIQYALENQQLSTIVYGLDLFSFRGDETRLRHGEGSLPLYLINDKTLDDFKYLLNIDIFFKDNLKILLSNFLGLKKDKIDFNKFWNWDYKYKFSKELCIKSYKESLKQNSKDNYKIEELKKSFDYNILSLYKKNPNLKFEIFFPPYSILTWKYWEHKKYLQNMLEFKEYIMRQSVKYNNVKIYDLQISKYITHDLNNYKDLSHYSGKINKWIIKQMKDDNYLVTENNIDEYLKKLKKQIENYEPLADSNR